jgi:XTP/dITP diphosphohydrolase
MKRLLIATSNPAKLAEYRLLLREFPIEAISLADAAINDHPEEDGATFKENALKKARFYFARARIPTLADDGGLEIDALGGEPGVKSHRWIGGAETSDAALVAEVIRRMERVESSRRSARLCAAVALIYEVAGVPREWVTQAAMEGVIAERAWPRVRAGFPYRSVLYLPVRGCYVAELGDEEEARISQRRVAIAELAPELTRIAEAQPPPA